MKLFGIICASLLVAFGLVETVGASDPKTERMLCQIWACLNRTISEEAYQRFAEGVVNASRSVNDLTHELSIDSASAFRWCDLADALLAEGAKEKATFCERRALALGPNIGPVLLRVANFDFGIGATTDGLQTLKHLLEITPEYDEIIFSDFDRLGGGIDQVLAQGIPVDKRAAQSFLRHLIAARGEPDATGKAWDWLTARSLAGERMAVEYVNYLVAVRQFDSAVEIWEKAAGARRNDYMRPNYVFNGDFKYAPAGVVLDWNVSVPQNVEYAWDKAELSPEARSLRLDFNAQDNLSFNGISQEVVVSPGTYRFRAFVKSDAITTNEGVGFHIYDFEMPSRLDVATEPLTGTSDWAEQQVRFTVPPKTRLLRMELRRQASHKLDNKIHGRYWCDRVRLERFQ